jgi:putative peptidoglycan lipid II flippase
LAHFLGLGPAADAFHAAFRLPNVLQTLFGEGALSASFIPVYARLRAAGDHDGARRVAGAVAGGLALVVAVAVLLGIALAPWLVDVLLPGFTGATRDLTVRLVRVLWPGVGIVVLSAWCLGVLNSHGRFFLSYAAPVAWNVAIILAVLIGAGRADDDPTAGGGAGRWAAEAGIALWAAAGAVAGSLLQFAVQLPAVLRLLGPPRLSLGRQDPAAAEVRRAFVPAVVSRGVVQISAYVDTFIASLLPTGAVAALVNAQLLATLPLSLFGMSVAAAELPAMAAERGRRSDVAAALRSRVAVGLDRIAFYVIPSAVAFLGIGHLLIALVFQGGRFTAEDTRLVWAALAAAGLGVPAATAARLLGSAHYALGDTRSPLRCALARIAVATAAGWIAARHGPAALDIPARWGVAGLTLASSAAAWLEWLLLRRSLSHRIGRVPGAPGHRWRVLAAAALAVAGGWAIGPGLASALPPAGQGLAAVLGFGLVYFSAAALFRLPEVREVIRHLAPLRRR